MVTIQPTSVTQATGEVLRRSMRAHKITVSTAARHLGIGRDTFTRRLDGPNGFAVAELERLAPLLGVTVSELLAAAESLLSSKEGVA